MFYQVNRASVCCISSKQFEMTPTEFLNSNYLKNLRQKFLNGEYDDTCIGCKRSEDAGLQSIRQHMVEQYGENTTVDLDYMELRTSNLCNFQCKMCNAQNSSLIAGQVTNITQESFDEIINLSANLKYLTLTGGEPMLIKHYYDLLDHLIALNKKDLRLRIYTNASVYNPVFVEKMLKFNTELHLSIDAIGKTAEAVRIGTDWTTVDKNINKFLLLPVEIFFHTTITAQSLSDIHSLAQYFVDILDKYPNCKFIGHTANAPVRTSVFFANIDNMQGTVDSIDRALDLLTAPEFKQLATQLISCKNIVSNRMKKSV